MSEAKKPRGRPPGQLNKRTQQLGPQVAALKSSAWDDDLVAFVLGVRDDPNGPADENLEQELDRLEKRYKAGVRDSGSRRQLARAARNCRIVSATIEEDGGVDDPWRDARWLKAAIEFLEAHKAVAQAEPETYSAALPLYMRDDPVAHVQKEIDQLKLERRKPSAKAEEFLRDRRIDRTIWEDARDCRYYHAGDEWVVEEFRPFLRPGKLKTVRHVVAQSDGWLIRKHAAPGFAAIPAQLRPMEEVVIDPRVVWHYHGGREKDTWPVFPEDAGKAAGKKLPRVRVMKLHLAAGHITKDTAKGEPYDPETGQGEHKGQNVDVVHKHEPDKAKYAMFGTRKGDNPDPASSSRIDLHPWAGQLLPNASVVFFAIEGTPKTDAILSAGGISFGVPSVTCWDAKELTSFAKRHLQGKVVLVVPDADWFTNPDVERQAYKIRSLLRRLDIGIDSHVCAPPTEEDTKRDGTRYCKGVDDFLGAGYTLGDLVLDGREPPKLEITWDAISCIQPPQRRSSARKALEDLSLFVDSERRLTNRGFPPDLGSLKRLLGVDKTARVVPLLESIAHTFTVEQGSLVTVLRSRFYGRYKSMTWEDTPTIRLDEQFRAYRRDRAKLRIADFWDNPAFKEQTRAIEELRAEVRHLAAERREAA